MTTLIFEVLGNIPKPGCPVGHYTATATGSPTVPAIIVGERGRKRRLGVLPLQLMPGGGETSRDHRVAAVKIDRRAGPKGPIRLVETDLSQASDEACIVVFRTRIGFRGWNKHTGDAVEGVPGEERKFLPLPGEVLTWGAIAEGDAGRMGHGEQVVLLLPRDQVVRTYIGGRVYGRPREWYYRFDGSTLRYVTAEDRPLVGL